MRNAMIAMIQIVAAAESNTAVNCAIAAGLGDVSSESSLCETFACDWSCRMLAQALNQAGTHSTAFID